MTLTGDSSSSPTTPPGTAGIEVQGLSHVVAGRTLFDSLDFVVPIGECVAVMGPSGSGKTTLLNLLAGIAPARHGAIRVAGFDMVGRSAGARAEHRRGRVGLVFQFGELLPELTVLENAALPLWLGGAVSRRQAFERAGEWLERLGVGQHAQSWIDALSGGEVQRVGIARALAHEPAVVLADEPTGNLDAGNAETVTHLLVEHSHRLGASGVVATHDPDVAAACDRVLRLIDGHLRPHSLADPISA